MTSSPVPSISGTRIIRVNTGRTRDLRTQSRLVTADGILPADTDLLGVIGRAILDCAAGNGKTSAATSPAATAGGPDRRRTGSNCSTWHRCRLSDTDTAAARSPTPGQCSTTPEWQTPWRARCRETGTAGSASGLGKRTRSNPGTAPQADSTRAIGSSGKARFHAAWSACGFALSRRQRET